MTLFFFLRNILLGVDLSMRYFYEKPQIYKATYGRVYQCDHPVYSSGTLFKMDNKGLVVIQQRYNPETKSTYWTEIDPWLVDDIYLHTGFKKFFDERSGQADNSLYPTVSVRQIMWALKMKPIQRERWETCFDRRII